MKPNLLSNFWFFISSFRFVYSLKDTVVVVSYGCRPVRRPKGWSGGETSHYRLFPLVKVYFDVPYVKFSFPFVLITIN